MFCKISGILVRADVRDRFRGGRGVARPDQASRAAECPIEREGASESHSGDAGEYRQRKSSVRRQRDVPELPRPRRERQWPWGNDAQSIPPQLYKLRLPEESDGWRIVLGHQKRQPRYRHGAPGPVHNHGGGSLDHCELRPELL